MMRNYHTVAMSAASVLLAALALAGCNKRDDAQTATSSDNTATVQRDSKVSDSMAKGVADTKEATSQVANDAKVAMNDAARDVKEASKNAADQASNKVSDALITTSVNAELAKDATLSALRINVDTESGRVALRGTAPDAAAKQRATQLASSVKGVVSVDNQLTIGKG
jgi:osmotically-inducible protein OsmY